ncbi:hypothetical protein [Marinobacter sp. VGCF2001]|uniref:hypothetical protein n=1 Tax=Marinobacter sp. VGCF2001 TaxID=3417189 RepID=UPI003CE81CDF
MFKKTLISLAVASSLGLTGCLSGSNSGGNDNPKPQYAADTLGKTYPIFNPATGALPLPNDLIFDSEQGDGTFGVKDTLPPVTTALNELSGASTVAPAVIQTSGQLDASTVVAGKTVHLIELSYASGDPVRGLAAQEPATLELALSGPQSLPKIRADVESLDGNSAIRILPLEPLNPQKRYVVLITTGVKDVNGDSIIQDPVYANATGSGTADDPAQGLVDGALLPVRTLINKLWEPIAVNYVKALGGSLTEEEIALTYSFTTSNDEKVLQYIAEPAKWVSDQLTTFVKTSAVAGKTSYAEAAAAAKQAVDTFPMSLPPNPKSPLNGLFAENGPCAGLTGAEAIECVGVALASQFAQALPTPLPGVNRSLPDGTGKIDFTGASPSPVGLVSAVAGNIPGSENVLAIEGTVELPYYLGSAPDEIAGLASLNWEADDELATDMNAVLEALELSLPQADSSVSKAVNYNFPFPKLQSRRTVPLLSLYPSDGNIKGAVIYQHGITTDRSAALTFGTALAAQGYAVFAIDQPLHGVAPFSEEEQLLLAEALIEAATISALLPDGVEDIEDLPKENAEQIRTQAASVAEALAPAAVAALTANDRIASFTTQVEAVENQLNAPGLITGDPTYPATATSLLATVENAGSTVPGLAPATNSEDALIERHFGLYATASGAPAAMDFTSANAAGTEGSGSFFINLENFLATRDNIRQGALDLMNLRASLVGIPTANIPGASLPLPSNGPAEVTAATPVYFVGHSLGTITGAPFMAAVNENSIEDSIYTEQDFSDTLPSAFNDVNAASLLTPGGGVVRLLENSPSFAPRILFGLQDANAALVQGSSSLESYLNILQAAIDTADPINFVDQLSEDMILLSEVAGETVIPNAADENVWGIAPLNDTLPPSETGLPVNITIESFPAPLSGTKPLTLGIPEITTYSAGSHGTPVSVDNEEVFGQMVCETLVTFGAEIGDLPPFCSGE